MSKSLISGGGAAAAAHTPHIHQPNKLLVIVSPSKGAKPLYLEGFKASLQDEVSKHARNPIYEYDCKNPLQVTITIEIKPELDRVKNILKTIYDTYLKTLNHRIKIEVVQPKKSDKYVDPKSLLPDFDPTSLNRWLGQTFPGIPLNSFFTSKKNLSFMNTDFLKMTTYFERADTISLRTQVKNTRTAKVYKLICMIIWTKTTSWRIAHPDCEGLPDKCLDMCQKRYPTFEQNWRYIGDVQVPEEILNCSACWETGFCLPIFEQKFSKIFLEYHGK